MLMFRFDKQICGILSVKDGFTENPWRTLVLPLARDSPALYHAIASMTAFHGSKETPSLRLDGMEHRLRSIRSLKIEIKKMRIDTALDPALAAALAAALATALALAFSESWDQHIGTGVEHLLGAKFLIHQALTVFKKGCQVSRLKFLCNTWIYKDVMTRLTSFSGDACSDDYAYDYVLEHFDEPPILAPRHWGFRPWEPLEIDPLFGCASTLFPLIGRAAKLCRRILSLPENTPEIISEAIQLQSAIMFWLARGSLFKRPEDPTTEVSHAMQTAEAYRYATLLYLQQVTPEISSLTNMQLARNVLVHLARVPLSSRLIVIQIYPLLVGGCEALDNDNRRWVLERWHHMASRMRTGNIDRCCEVTQEVWSRRDSFLESKSKFSMGNYNRDELVHLLAPETTVRGRLHWMGVMRDWDWKVSF
jgi:hypothetical protein